MRVNLLLLAGIVLLAGMTAAGAELQLRAKCQPQRAIVTLGDVAEICAVDPQDAQALAAIELFPTPAPGQQRIARVPELQDLLSMRRVNLLAHRFSGSSQTVVLGPGESGPRADQRPVSSSMLRRAERLVQEAVERFLREHAPAGQAWSVRVSLTDSQARKIPADGRGISVRGGRAPWTGTQRLELVVDSPTEPAEVPIEVEIAALAPVVVAVASLPRGAIVRAADVQLQPASPENAREQAMHSLEEVVGRELAQAVAAGTVVQPSQVRAPIVVRRNDVITVTARSAGVRVRTIARARQDGGLDDLIAVESLPSRKVYTARVSGPGEAEVYARPIQAPSAAARDPVAAPAGTLAHGQERNRK